MEILANLSKSESENVRLRALGFINKEIADQRCVTLETVKKQFKVAVAKTNVRSTFELVARYAQANPNLFKNAVASLFLVIQIGMITQTHKVERTHRTSRTRTHKTVRRNLA